MAKERLKPDSLTMVIALKQAGAELVLENMSSSRSLESILDGFDTFSRVCACLGPRL